LYKALVAADNDRIPGFTAFGREAGEVMAIVQVAIAAGASYTVMRDLDHDAPDNGGRARCALPIGARRRCRGFVDPAGRRLSFDDPPRISP
jgi:hypothetical protein